MYLQARPRLSLRSTGYQLSSTLFHLIFTIICILDSYNNGNQLLPPPNHAPLQCNLATLPIEVDCISSSLEFSLVFLLWPVLETWCCETSKGGLKRACQLFLSPHRNLPKALNARQCAERETQPTATRVCMSGPRQDQQNDLVDLKHIEKLYFFYTTKFLICYRAVNNWCTPVR